MQVKNKYGITAIIIGFFMLQACQAFALTLSGSTTVQKRILEPVAAAVEKDLGIKYTVLGVGTGKGFEDLRAGRVDASIASMPLDDLLVKAGVPNDKTYVESVIIKDEIVPIVHKDNPIKKLTWAQLSDINTGKITNWNELGGPDLPIIVITSHKGSATKAFFQEEVMKKQEYVAKARTVQSTREEVQLVSKYMGGIGAVSRAFVEMSTEKVQIVDTKDIIRPLSFITKGAPAGEVLKLLNYLKTDKAQKLFE